MPWTWQMNTVAMSLEPLTNFAPCLKGQWTNTTPMTKQNENMKTHNTPQPLGNMQAINHRTIAQQYDDTCDAIKSARDGLWRPTKKQMADLMEKRNKLSQLVSNFQIK
jgi:hypothetical protein